MTQQQLASAMLGKLQVTENPHALNASGAAELLNAQARASNCTTRGGRRRWQKME